MLCRIRHIFVIAVRETRLDDLGKNELEKLEHRNVV